MSVIWASRNFFFALAVMLFELSSLAPCAASLLPIVDLGYARHRASTFDRLIYATGGGYAAGSKYDGDFEGLFARAKETYGSEFIWVSLNYRLGALGFLAGPEFVSSGGTPNLGLLDQRLALRWVRNNIHLFGGDKDKVTAIGSSAGAGSIIHHITAYGGSAENDFQKAFVGAPGVLDSDSNATLDKAFANFLRFAGVSSLSEARNLPSQQVINANAAQIAGAGYGSFIFGPAIDGSLVTRDPQTILDSGLVNPSLSVLVGHNTNEGYGFGPPIRNETEFRAFIAFRFPNATQSVIDYIVNELYPPIFDGSHGYTDNMRRGLVAVTEFQFTCSASALAHAAEEKAYAYAFGIPPALHVTDGAYVFHNPKHSTRINTTVANVLQDHVLTFILKGSPESSLDGIDVPAYGNNSNAVIFSSGDITVAKDPAANFRCQWWRRGLYN
ncbi:hypothetical protein DL767_000616 [Monosporascus sp. MG133]|nr:hypothetical protein DL767_000616 [Monosporascus sp. MG133]